MRRRLSSYTNKELLIIAKKFNDRNSFYQNKRNICQEIKRRKLWEKATNHMKILIRRYTNEELIIEAKKYKKIKDFRAKNINMYNVAQQRGLLKKCCSHMKKRGNNLTNQEIYSIAKKYERRVDFQQANWPAYYAARRRGILDKVCKHMKSKGENISKALESWSSQRIWKCAKKCASKSEFRRRYEGAYCAARKKGIWTKICSKLYSKGISQIFKEELVVYPMFDKLFKPLVKELIDGNKNWLSYNVRPDRILNVNGKFFIIELKRDDDRLYNKEQFLKYKKYQKKHRQKYVEFFLVSPNGGYKNSISFFELKNILTTKYG